jgi:hypothetical protein
LVLNSRRIDWMTEEEVVDELGVGANPNEIAIVLHDWLDSVPENPRDPLWREVWFLMIGYEVGPDHGYDDVPDFGPDFWALIEPLTDGYNLHERRADAYRAVQLLRRVH